MAVFTMPSLGADMEAGTLTEWMIKPGDTVTRGDVVAVVETQKGAIEIECFQDGTVETLDADIGETLPVGAPMATIRAPGDNAPAPAEAAASPKTPPAPKAPAPPPAMPDTDETPPASPAARALAAERGVDLAALSGTGPGGAIVLADVEAAAAPARKPQAEPGAGLDMAAMRTAIANAMARSKREIPHYYLSQTIDLQTASDWLTETNATRAPGARLLMSALLVKATARAAAETAQMNGHYDADGFHPASAVHAGVAIALRGGGLVAPALHDAQDLPLDTLMARMRDLVTRARSGRLRASEMTDGTITVSAMGDTGADAMAAVIYPPQVAIVGFGAPVSRPWVTGDTIAPRMTVTATLSADHRVSDGRLGARFLAAIDAGLQAPAAL
ncbi:MAG: dihydrolipoamide acetyltransferase family protein [Sediminimonas sp.]|uniref:dihydrolipoamide acetyltransferase family protein n=1 Tax=Sediminimonas sp. TaxID=2823379 RepID=UPI002870A429|nr:dihydrolipoamide acetyltransferase family protein [Sediminimonas sp.]MDR9486051.1 dihydrolipoamide acetyltransferase family protein [Sediminimonas sp.]